MTRIIEDLLELSRFEANDAPIKGLPVDVAALAASLRKDVLARHAHPRTVEVAIESGAMLVGDEAMIQSAFSNLVDNAAKYTPPEGSMVIRFWTDEQGGHFSVRDTGLGIPTEHLPRLTERFYRVDPGRSRETGGSGLGLAIVKHALHRHGAHLRDRKHRRTRQHLHLSLSAGARARAARRGQRLNAPVMKPSRGSNKLRSDGNRRSVAPHLAPLQRRPRARAQQGAHDGRHGRAAARAMPSPR